MVLEISENKVQKEVRSRLVIFADGPVTLAHRCFGIGFDAKSQLVAVSVICDFTYPENDMDTYDAYYVREAAPPSFAWNFPFSQHLNFGLLIPRTFMEKNKDLFNNVLDYMLKRYPPSSGRINGRSLIRKRGAFLPMRMAQEIHDDSCLVVGDAAGLVSPITGVGITFAMHSGASAAETALEALKQGEFGKDFLSRYPKNWRASRKYKKLWVMETLYRILEPLHRLDPQLLNKMLFFSNMLFTKAEGKRIRFVDALRVLFFPLLGNPNLTVVRSGKGEKESSGLSLDKGV